MVSWTLVALLTAVLTVRLKPDYSIYSSYILTSTIFTLIAWVIRFIVTAIIYPAYLTPLKNIPTPSKRSWLFGNGHSADIKFPVELGRNWIKTIPNTGLLRYYSFGSRERVLVVSPKAIADLLVNNSYDFGRPEVATVQLEKVTGHGLLIAEGEVHKAQRKSLMPSFSYRHIKDLYPLFWSKAIQMANEIEKGINNAENGEDTIKTSKWSSRAMLDIIGLAGFGYDFNSLLNQDNELARRYDALTMTPIGIQKFIALFCLFIVGFKWYYLIPSPQSRQIDDTMKYIRSLAYEHVTKKKARAEQQALQKEGDGNTADVDILSVAIRSGNFTNDDLVNHMMTFLAAGHETTSSAFQWSIYVLSKHPEIQTRLRQELRNALPQKIPFEELGDMKNIKDENGSIKEIFSAIFDSIDGNTSTNIPYLWAFINEVFRFHPSVHYTSRISVRDTTLAGQPIPKGTTVFISPEVTNKDPNLWGEDAETFNVERWLNIDPESKIATSYNNIGGGESNYAMTTFLHGPRSCIGQRFSRAELAIFVAVFVYRFDFGLADPNEKLVVKGSITQSPSGGVVIKVRKAI